MVGDTCPVDAFATAVARLEAHLPAVMTRLGVAAVVEHYKSFASVACAPQAALWPPSDQHPLLIVGGPGTTGTSFTACIAVELGLRVTHWDGSRHARTRA